MVIIKFDLEKLKKNLNGFSYYILGRSYDLEENGATEDFKEALKYYNEGMNLNYPLCEYSLGISLILGLGDVLEIDKEKGNKLLIDAYPKIIDLINNPLIFFPLYSSVTKTVEIQGYISNIG